ncbi:MAG: LacI family DNA-binding transcriptional regulator [Chloroflexota bacterium]
MSTIKDVAALAGVSQSTVSAVFGGRVPVRAKTRTKVLVAAEHLGYRPHGPAQALRTGSSRTLGLYVSFVTNPVIAAVVQGASRRATTAGYALTVSSVEDDPALERIHLNLLARQRVAAVIAYATSADPGLYDELRQAGIPIVFISSRPPGLAADLIMGDNQEGVRAAVRHLLASGRRRVGLLVGPPPRQTNIGRVAGYRAAYAEAGLAEPEGFVCPSLRTTADAYAATEALLERRSDAVVASVSSLTAGALKALRVRGVAVPEEVAFVGSGDAEWGVLAQPPLTMLETDGEVIGRLAVETALERLGAEGRSIPAREILVPLRFVVRASSATAALPLPEREHLPGEVRKEV